MQTLAQAAYRLCRSFPIGHMWLIIIDAHSKWLEVFKMSSTTPAATIQCLRDVFTRFGLPEKIVTDNAPNFTSTELSNF